MDFQNIDSSEFQQVVLDNLPFGVSVQNRDFELVYQNAYLRNLFPTDQFTYCYQRWADYEDYGTNKCKDCPLQVTVIDNQSHSILRKMRDSSGNQKYFKIQHQPLIIEDGFERFIEIVNQVPENEISNFIDLEDIIPVKDEIYYSIGLFGDDGGNIFTHTLPDSFDADLNSFLLTLTQFWMIAIGQGDNWPLGLFGPLPVFDRLKYDSYAFSFRIKNKQLQDIRFAGHDVGVLIFILRKGNKIFNQHRELIEVKINELFQNIASTDDLYHFDCNEITQIFDILNNEKSYSLLLD